MPARLYINITKPAVNIKNLWTQKLEDLNLSISKCTHTFRRLTLNNTLINIS